MKRFDHEVIVIGGGPAGSTCGNLLAQAGVDALVIERERFPRFHVGESLLPADLEVFERLGIDVESEPFVYKSGAEFLDESIGGQREFPFSVALPGTPDHAYHVERGPFDRVLLERAKEVGCVVREGERATRVDVGDTGVDVETTSSSYRGRYLIDATGLDAFLGRRDKTTTVIDDFGRGAVFSHWEELAPEIDHELRSLDAGRGNIKVLFVADGWAWVIPIGPRRVSIGMVTRIKGSISAAAFERQVAGSAFLSRITKGARCVRRPFTLASFSFHNREQHGARWACAGDAACFLDPVFSSGVSLGMLGAAHLVDALVPALADSREAASDLLDDHVRHMAHAYDVFATLIHAWYHSNLLHHLFFAPEPDPMMLRGVTSVLAGDVWRSDNPFQEKLMASKRRRQELVPSYRR